MNYVDYFNLQIIIRVVLYIYIFINTFPVIISFVHVATIHTFYYLHAIISTNIITYTQRCP